MQIIKKYFPDLSQSQLEQFALLEELYFFWNQRINLISRKDINHLYLHHVLHSLSIAKVMSFNPSSKILDVGTGGGFPGIPLSIFFPEVSFHLIDPIGKKIKVVKEISSVLALNNVTSEQIRAEQLKTRYDFVISRAVTNLSEFISWVHGKINKTNQHKIQNGIFYLKGGNLDEEIKPYKKIATVFDISDFFKEEYFMEKKIIYLPLQ